MYNKVDDRGFISSLNGGNKLDIEQPTRFLGNVTFSGSFQFGTTIQPEIIYVSLSGSDSAGDGSYLNPYRTLVKAVNVISSSGNASTSHPYTVQLGGGVFYETVPIQIPSSVGIRGTGNGLTRVATTNTGSIMFNLDKLSFLRDLTLHGGTSYSNVGLSIQITGSAGDPTLVDAAVWAPRVYNTTLLNCATGALVSGPSSSLLMAQSYVNDCKTGIKVIDSAFFVECSTTIFNYSLTSGSAIVVENYNDTPTDLETPVIFTRDNHFRYCENAFHASNVDQSKGIRMAVLASHFTSCSNIANLNDSSNIGIVSCQVYSTANYEIYQGYPGARFKIFNTALELNKVFIQPTGYENVVGTGPDKNNPDSWLLQGAHPELWFRSTRSFPTFWRILGNDAGALQFDINTHTSGTFTTYQ